MAQNGNTMPNKRLIILSLLDTFISKCIFCYLTFLKSKLRKTDFILYKTTQTQIGKYMNKFWQLYLVIDDSFWSIW